MPHQSRDGPILPSPPMFKLRIKIVLELIGDLSLVFSILFDEVANYIINMRWYPSYGNVMARCEYCDCDVVVSYLSMVITGKCIQECKWCWNNATSAPSYPEEPIYSELVFKSQTELDQAPQFSGQVFMPRSGSISLISLLINQSGGINLSF